MQEAKWLPSPEDTLSKFYQYYTFQLPLVYTAVMYLSPLQGIFVVIHQVSLVLWLDGEWLYIARCHRMSTHSLLQPTLLLFLEYS